MADDSQDNNGDDDPPVEPELPPGYGTTATRVGLPDEDLIELARDISEGSEPEKLTEG